MVKKMRGMKLNCTILLIEEGDILGIKGIFVLEFVDLKKSKLKSRRTSFFCRKHS